MTDEIPFTGKRILIKQNESRALQQLAAQRSLYSRAKKILASQLVLIIPVSIILATFGNFYPDIRVWIAAYGISLLFLTAFILEPWQQRTQQLAADIQELFDTEIFGLEWPKWKIQKKPDPEEVISAAEKFRKRSPQCEELKNWYPAEIDPLPFPLARLVCQRASIRYDSQLRKYYSHVILAAVVIIGVLIFVYAIAYKTPSDQVVLFLVAPFLPFWNWGLREYFRQQKASEILERTKGYIQEIWEESLRVSINLSEVNCQTRNIQDQIYDMRRSNPLIFEFIYRRKRSKLESEMDKGAKELVRDAIQSLK